MVNLRFLLSDYLRDLRYQILDRKVIIFNEDGDVKSVRPRTFRSLQKIIRTCCWDRSISSILVQVTYIDSERDEATLPLVLVVIIKASVHVPILS